MRTIAHNEPIGQLRRFGRETEGDTCAPIVGHQDHLAGSVLLILPAHVSILQLANELRHGLEHGGRIELVEAIAASVTRKINGNERGIAQFLRGELVFPKSPGVREAVDEDHQVRGGRLVGGLADHVVEADILLDNAEPMFKPWEGRLVEGPDFMSFC